MAYFISLDNIKNLFKQLKESSTAKHLINDKLTDEQRDKFYEMDEFFRLLSEEDFNLMENKQHSTKVCGVVGPPTLVW